MGAWVTVMGQDAVFPSLQSPSALRWLLLPPVPLRIPGCAPESPGTGGRASQPSSMSWPPFPREPCPGDVLIPQMVALLLIAGPCVKYPGAGHSHCNAQDTTLPPGASGPFMASSQGAPWCDPLWPGLVPCCAWPSNWGRGVGPKGLWAACVSTPRAGQPGQDLPLPAPGCSWRGRARGSGAGLAARAALPHFLSLRCCLACLRLRVVQSWETLALEKCGSPGGDRFVTVAHASDQLPVLSPVNHFWACGKVYLSLGLPGWRTACPGSSERSALCGHTCVRACACPEPVGAAPPRSSGPAAAEPCASASARRAF